MLKQIHIAMLHICILKRLNQGRLAVESVRRLLYVGELERQFHCSHFFTQRENTDVLEALRWSPTE